MATTRLQTTIELELKEKAEKKFDKMGLNINEGLRMLLTLFIKEAEGLKSDMPVIQLSAKAIERYDKILDEIDSGKAELYEYNGNLDDALEEVK